MITGNDNPTTIAPNYPARAEVIHLGQMCFTSAHLIIDLGRRKQLVVQEVSQSHTTQDSGTIFAAVYVDFFNYEGKHLARLAQFNGPNALEMARQAMTYLFPFAVKVMGDLGYLRGFIDSYRTD